jgi:two-component system, cell cycle sensor histidine kinase and response regulator CckA
MGKDIRMLTRVRYVTLSYVGVITAITLGLYSTSLFSYLLFHSLVEISTIAIGFTLFILAWNTRRFLTNDCLKLIGIGYGFIAVIDLLHTLAYKGINVFPGYGANLPTQLWIAARFLQAATLCMAPVFIRRRISGHFLIGAYFAVVAMAAALVFSGNFPDCYVEGKGLTPFKVISEYAISAMLVIALIFFHKVRTNFNRTVYALIIASIACTAVSEISFTAYLSVYGFANLLGHLLKLAAFWLIYRALLVTGLKEPFDLIFRDLKQTEEALLKAHDSLEDKVRERTVELRASEEKYRGLIQKIQVAVVVHGADTRILTSNLLAQQLIGFTEEQLMGKSGFDPDWHFFREDGTAILPEEYPVNQVLTSKQPIRNAVAGVHCPGMEEDVWVLVSADPVLDEQGEVTQVIVTFVDITERKRAEEVLRRMNRELRAVSNCNQVLMRAEDEQTLLYEICRIICDDAGYRMAWVGYAENDDAKSVRPVAWAGVEDGYLAIADITWADLERGRGPTGTAVRSGESAWIKDFTTDPKATPWRDGALQRGYRSSIAIPLKDESGNTFGALTIYSTEPDTFDTPDEVRLLEELTDDLAFGITVLRVRNAQKEAERNIALLSFALDNVHEAAFLIDESARFRYVNEESCRALEYAREELFGLGVADVDPDFPMERWAGHWDELKTHGSLTFESRHKAKDGRIIPVEIYSNYFEYYGAGYILALARDITERKRVEDALRFIAQRGWAGTADTFLTALAGHLGDTLGMDYVLIAQLADDDHGMAETAALYAKGEIIPNMRYGLKGTPCENVTGKNLCLYPEGVQALFPADTLLADMGAESYAGIPLWDSAGRPIGLLAVLDGRPFHDEGMISYILQLTAASAAAALERERNDRLLIAREREFRTLAENSPDSILRYDNGCRCIYANPRIENTLGIPAGGMPGKTPMEIFPAGEYREYQDRIEEVLRTGAEADLEVVVPDTGEGVRYHHVRFTAERDQEGAITGVLVIGRNITERKQMENVLRESEERFRTLTEQSPVGIHIIEDDLFRYVNPAFAEIHGYTPEEIINRLGPVDFITPEDRERVLDSIRHSTAGEKMLSRLEFHIKRKDGSIRAVEVFGSRASHRGYPAIIGTIIDVTERKRSEEKLFQVTERWERTFDAVPDLIAIIDTDFRIVQANKAMAERLGATPEECAGHVCYEAVHGTKSPPSFCPHTCSLRDCREHAAEVSEERLGGDFIVSTSPIYDSKGGLIGCVHVARDITERKRAETRLNEQLLFLQQLLDSIPIPVYYKDVDGLYLGCNTAFEAFICLPRREIVGKTVYDVTPKERADRHHEADSALLCQPGAQIYEVSGTYKNGEHHDVIFNKATFVDANDRVAGIVGAMMDITSLRKAEEERKLLEAQLHQAQKMEAIGQLAGGIAHDFNNILTAIMGCAEITLLRMENGSPLRHYVEQILTSSERAAELTNALLTFSRRQVLHTKPIDLCGVVRDLKKMLGRLIPEDIDFRTQLAEGTLIVMADKGQIEQVLMNLVTNAKDAMPNGGTLTIDVSPAIMDERFVHAHGFGDPGDYACVTVADTGQGMDEETAKRIFEPFYTTKEVGKGTGLGMAIIYGIIQQHNGCITVHSEQQRGTTFKIYLPRIAEKIDETHVTREAEPSPGGTETILLAEDDMAVRELHKMILEEAGYGIVEAVDGQDALDKFMERMAEVDIVVTDVIMPKIDGKSLYEEIRKIRPDMKVLFMSGYTKDIIVKRGILEDEFSYISKPVKSFELLKKVRDVLDRDRCL